jgi:hypothetical protein
LKFLVFFLPNFLVFDIVGEIILSRNQSIRTS